jgi:hypothetical protein
LIAVLLPAELYAFVDPSDAAGNVTNNGPSTSATAATTTATDEEAVVRFCSEFNL